ncbi:sulfite exporter TauE/SafE family protein [Phyllobacterium pellucidum]|uniref:sulfite exporter TauE/SafE family protein n=1 Tax=Phyllobacterium pellucidum TaxID=2740464 RepID=UPI001D1452A5|nr:sulfite exporter TauE/SafE family protein [Phyllobacterium sp. T1018]UGY09772.1 sulfite exporter TauE/SafE family protein [Phyllobacterium sp. T1018]
MPDLLMTPWFYAAAVPATILIGLSKGGLGGAMGQVGVPLMALVMPPVQAAAIMLPILIVMDVASLWSWRGYRDNQTLKLMLPGAFLGIGIGWLTASIVTDDMVKLIVGAIAIIFFARYMLTSAAKRATAQPHNGASATLWSTLAGFTSFVAHAGGPPYQVYALPLRQDPKVYNGTSVIFFAIVNAVKVIPYFALGQFDTANLRASAVLLPLAPLATFAGAWIVKRMRPEIFYPFMYIMILLMGLKLTYDGVVSLL